MKRRSATAKRVSPKTDFIRETVTELKKVVWLTRQEVIRLTALVLIITITVGLILGIIDYGFTRLINDLLLGG